MPLFEYGCQECKAQFELLRPHAEADSAACPQCGSASVERHLSTFGVSAAQPEPVCPGGVCDNPRMPGCPTCPNV